MRPDVPLAILQALKRKLYNSLEGEVIHPGRLMIEKDTNAPMPTWNKTDPGTDNVFYALQAPYGCSHQYALPEESYPG